MFDHRSYATEGLYPGSVTTMAVANQGSFLDRVIAVVKKTLHAITTPYVATKAAVQDFLISARTASESKVAVRADTMKLSAATIVDQSKATSTSTTKIVADTDNYRGKVRVAKKKSIKAE